MQNLRLKVALIHLLTLKLLDSGFSFIGYGIRFSRNEGFRDPFDDLSNFLSSREGLTLE